MDVTTLSSPTRGGPTTTPLGESNLPSDFFLSRPRCMKTTSHQWRRPPVGQQASYLRHTRTAARRIPSFLVRIERQARGGCSRMQDPGDRREEPRSHHRFQHATDPGAQARSVTEFGLPPPGPGVRSRLRPPEG